MKEYKLIKKYPTVRSLEVGSTVREGDGFQNATGWYHGFGCQCFPKHEVEHFPEFWQEVKPVVKKPILTTEDGIDIYNKDVPVYHVGVNGHCNYYIFKDKASFAKNIGTVCFSSKEAAENFVFRNKPVLSLNDVFSVYPEFKKKEPETLTHHAQQLIDKVKK